MLQLAPLPMPSDEKTLDQLENDFNGLAEETYDSVSLLNAGSTVSASMRNHIASKKVEFDAAHQNFLMLKDIDSAEAESVIRKLIVDVKAARGAVQSLLNQRLRVSTTD